MHEAWSAWHSRLIGIGTKFCDANARMTKTDRHRTSVVRQNCKSYQFVNRFWSLVLHGISDRNHRVSNNKMFSWKNKQSQHWQTFFVHYAFLYWPSPAPNCANSFLLFIHLDSKTPNTVRFCAVRAACTKWLNNLYFNWVMRVSLVDCCMWLLSVLN